MRIDATTENLLGLSEAAKLLPRINGRKVATSTLWRWCRKGLRGVRLEYLRMGRDIVTSRQALGRFFRELADTDADHQQPRNTKSTDIYKRGITSKARLRAMEAADVVLAEAGI